MRPHLPTSTRPYIVLAFLLAMAPALHAQDWALKTPEAVLEANIKATGGAAAWEAVKTLRLEGTMEMDSPMGGVRKGTFAVQVRLPGYSHRAVTMDSPMGEMTSTIITTPDAAWATSNRGGRRTLPDRDWIDLDAAKEELALLANDAYTLTALETEIGEAGPMYVVTVAHGGTTYRRHYDQISLMLLAAERPSVQGGKEWIYYDDYREVDGLTMAHGWTSQAHLVMQRGGGSAEEHTVETRSTLATVTVNPPVQVDLFKE